MGGGGGREKVTSSFNFNICIILIGECHISMKCRKWIFLSVCLSVLVVCCRNILLPTKSKFPGKSQILFQEPHLQNYSFPSWFKTVEIFFNQQGKFMSQIVFIIFLSSTTSHHLFATPSFMQTRTVAHLLWQYTQTRKYLSTEM